MVDGETLGEPDDGSVTPIVRDTGELDWQQLAPVDRLTFFGLMDEENLWLGELRIAQEALKILSRRKRELFRPLNERNMIAETESSEEAA